MTEFSDAEIARAVSAYKAHGSERKAATALGLSKTAIHERLTRATLRGDLGFKPVLPGMELKRSSAQLDGDGAVQKEWVTQHRESGPLFKMPAGQITKGVSAFLDGEGRIRHQWIKTKAESVNQPALIAALKAEFDDYRGRARLVPPPRKVDRDLLSVYPIADLHLGMLAWRPQTGADYDLRIATERLLDCASAIIAKADRSRSALIANLGDWYHANDQRNVTPRSNHQLDVDGRWFKVQRAGLRAFRSVIDMALAKHQNVDVINIPGNHDPEATPTLALALGEFYSRNKRVNIAFPSDIYYRRFGTNLIGAAHGDKAPASRLAMAMAVDERKAWGETAYHWIMSGHIHKDKMDTIGDVRVEVFSTIADKDNHAAGGAWRNTQALNAITLHRRDGEVGRHRVNIPPPGMR